VTLKTKLLHQLEMTEYLGTPLLLYHKTVKKNANASEHKVY